VQVQGGWKGNVEVEQRGAFPRAANTSLIAVRCEGGCAGAGGAVASLCSSFAVRDKAACRVLFGEGSILHEEAANIMSGLGMRRGLMNSLELIWVDRHDGNIGSQLQDPFSILGGVDALGHLRISPR